MGGKRGKKVYGNFNVVKKVIDYSHAGDSDKPTAG